MKTPCEDLWYDRSLVQRTISYVTSLALYLGDEVSTILSHEDVAVNGKMNTLADAFAHHACKAALGPKCGF